MEHTDTKKQIMILIGIWIAVILLLVAIIVMIKNVNEIRQDPIVYGIKKHNFEICSCFNDKGEIYKYNEESQVFDKRGVFDINLSGIYKD